MDTSGLTIRTLGERCGARVTPSLCHARHSGVQAATSFVLLLLLLGAPVVEAQKRRAGRAVPNPVEEIRQLTLRTTDRVVNAYADEDLLPLWTSMSNNPRATENALYAIIPPARAFALIVRYENGEPDPELLRRAMDILSISIDSYPDWGGTWASPSVVYTVTLTAYRLRQHTGLPPDLLGRAGVLWSQARVIAEMEANAGLATPLPAPMDSSETGDSKAEEFAWATTHFAAAILASPDHPNVPLWERRMRQMGYNAISRPSDPPDMDGLKYTTVTEDWGLNNHDLEKNPFYTAATINLLGWSVLAYSMTGRDAPQELLHNVRPLYQVYLTYCSVAPDGRHYWNRPSDAGDPTLFPLGVMGDARRDLTLARGRADRWLLTYPVPAGPLQPDDFYATVENHKIAIYAIFGLYLWYYPAPTPPDSSLAAALQRGE